jgi:hypothetical protein
MLILKSKYHPASGAAGRPPGRTQNKITKRSQFVLCFQQNFETKAKFQPLEATLKPQAGAPADAPRCNRMLHDETQNRET